MKWTIIGIITMLIAMGIVVGLLWCAAEVLVSPIGVPFILVGIAVLIAYWLFLAGRGFGKLLKISWDAAKIVSKTDDDNDD